MGSTLVVDSGVSNFFFLLILCICCNILWTTDAVLIELLLLVLRCLIEL